MERSSSSTSKLKSELAALRREIEAHNYSYHVLDTPTVPDAETTASCAGCKRSRAPTPSS